MSKQLSSSDPQSQKILDLVYWLSNKALDKALTGWSKDKKQNDFFMAACCKQGAGVVRILASHGLYCQDHVLALATKRECWHVAKELAKVVPSLTPLYVSAYGGTLCDHPLLDALAEGQDALARALFEIHMPGVDQKNKANFALHALAKNAKKTTESAASVEWLVQAGADPNKELIRNHHPLQTSFEQGAIEFAMALLDTGANLASLPNAGAMVATALYRSRDKKVNDPTSLRISNAGWALVDRTVALGVPLPALVEAGPIAFSKNGGATFEGFDRFTGCLHKEDVSRIKSIQEEKYLQDQTALSHLSRSGFRL